MCSYLCSECFSTFERQRNPPKPKTWRDKFDDVISGTLGGKPAAEKAKHIPSAVDISNANWEQAKESTRRGIEKLKRGINRTVTAVKDVAKYPLRKK